MSDDNQNTPPNQTPPGPFSPEQMAALSQIVNSAITSHSKRQKPLAEELKAVDWSALMKPTFDKFVQDYEATDDTETPSGDPSQPAKPDPRVVALETKLAAFEAKAREDAEKLAKAQAEAWDKDAMAALKAALVAHTRPEALEIAARDLFLGQKRITKGEDGAALMTVKRPQFPGGPEEEVAMPIADAVALWAKSEGKFFAPAPTAAGGAPAGQAPRRVSGGEVPAFEKPAATNSERDARIQARAAALSQKYAGRFSQ